MSRLSAFWIPIFVGLVAHLDGWSHYEGAMAVLLSSVAAMLGRLLTLAEQGE
jgi:hypothetical protein